MNTPLAPGVDLLVCTQDGVRAAAREDAAYWDDLYDHEPDDD